MTKFARMIDVLDLYSERDTLLTAEEIAERLNVSRPTAFRYARELTTAGFLANYSGRYSLGARIITLDYRIREADPVLRVAREVMRRLTAETASGAILCRMYNEEVINVHHESGYDAVAVSFGRGRPLPLFRGAASKIMLAFMPPARLKKLYERHRSEPDVLTFATDWPTFKAYYARIREQGHYISEREVEDFTVGIGAPITVPGTGTVAAISLVLSADRLALINTQGYASVVTERAREISRLLAQLVPCDAPTSAA